MELNYSLGDSHGLSTEYICFALGMPAALFYTGDCGKLD
jgi:hypothetical protein